MTGQYLQKLDKVQGAIGENIKTMPQLLKESGYTTFFRKMAQSKSIIF